MAHGVEHVHDICEQPATLIANPFELRLDDRDRYY